MSIQRIKAAPINTSDSFDNWIIALQKSDGNFFELYKRFTPQVIAAVVAGTTPWDVNLGGYAQLLMGAGNTTLGTVANTFNGCMLTLEIVQDSVGSRTVTWPSQVVWAAGAAPTLTLTANKRDFINFIGANGLLYGTALLNFA